MAVAVPLAGYVRVSFVGGRSGDSFHSPDDQTREIQTWAKTRGLEVVMLPPELDRKGTDATRPIFRQAIDGVKSGRYSGLVVAYLSRAGRDLRLMLDMWDEVEAAGGAVHSARENIDASTPSGRLQRNLLASVAQHELEERREGFERARAGAVAAGVWQRRQTPRGYDRDPVTRGLVPNGQALEVRQAFSYRVGGMPLTQIADMLGMTPSGVRALLRNRVYLGELKVGEHINPEGHEPIVDRDLFDAAQGLAVSRPPRSFDETAVLAGLARCAGCGHVMSRAQTKRVIYTCHGRHSGGRCPQPAAITARLLDEHVDRIARDVLARGSADPVRDERGLRAARAAERTADAELAAFLEGVAAAGLAPGDFADGARARREARDAARMERERIEASERGPALVDLAALWDDLGDRERNHALRSLLEAVVVRAAGRGKFVPVADRVRVISQGTGLIEARPGGGVAHGLRPIVFPKADGPGVLRVTSSE